METQAQYNTVSNTETHTVTHIANLRNRNVNGERIPLPRGELKQLAAKLGCHVNTIRNGWKNFDPVWIERIKEHLEHVTRKREEAIRLAKSVLQTQIRAVRREKREREIMSNFLKKEV